MRLRAQRKISARGSVYGCLSASLGLEGLTRVLREYDAFHLEVEHEDVIARVLQTREQKSVDREWDDDVEVGRPKRGSRGIKFAMCLPR